MINYFAYASNMDKEYLDMWCKNKGCSMVRFQSISPAKLNGYKLSFNYFSISRNGGAANIMESKKDYVYGLLIEVEESDLQVFRKKEGYPKYYDEIYVDVEKFDGTIVKGVKTYKVVKSSENPNHQPPTKDYLQLIIKNAQKHNFPSEYIQYLEAIKAKEEPLN